MKWAAGILAAMLYLVWPYYTLLDLAQAIKSGNATTINQIVDWQPVRTSVKSQMQDYLEKMPKPATEEKNPGFAAFGNAFVLTVANSFIDKLLTPEGISRAIQGLRASSPQTAKANARPGNAPNQNDSLLSRVNYAFFLTPIHFLLNLKSADPTDNQTVSLVLTFKGTGWQVTDLRLPKNTLSPKIAQASAH